MNIKTGNEIVEELYGKVSKPFNLNKSKEEWISLNSLKDFMYKNNNEITLKELNRNGRIALDDE